MKVLVPVKRVIDYRVHVRVKPDGTGVETAGVKMSMNPFDEIAVEEAVKIKEAGIADEVIVVSLGDDQSKETLHTALAIGADKAILIKTDQSFDSLNVAKCLKVIVEKEQPDLVICGKQAIDSDANQTGQMLAALLSWPQATFANAIRLNDRELEVVREVDGGLATVAMSLPAVVTTDLRLNTPRYPSMPNIMKAKSKTMDVLEADALGVTFTHPIKRLSVSAPNQARETTLLDDVTALVDVLKNKEQVL